MIERIFMSIEDEVARSNSVSLLDRFLLSFLIIITF